MSQSRDPFVKMCSETNALMQQTFLHYLNRARNQTVSFMSVVYKSVTGSSRGNMFSVVHDISDIVPLI